MSKPVVREKCETEGCENLAANDYTDVCQSCCGEHVGHERDPDEGMMCLNCDAEWDGP